MTAPRPPADPPGRPPTATRPPVAERRNHHHGHALSGVRVLEVAAWTFVPAAGAVLADWGADVIKVEHPETGDPQRGLVSMGLIPGGHGAVNYIMEQPNRGKRSIGIDISTDGGRDLLYKLAETVRRVPDQLPARRAPAAQDRRRAHPGGQPEHRLRPGLGPGPARSRPRKRPGYDGCSYWGRGGIANALTPGDSEVSRSADGPAFGDLAGGMAIAGGIAAGLLQMARTGEAPVIDVSLLGLAMWQLSPTSWPRASTAATPCPSSTAAPRPTRWWATTGPATTGSSP